MANCLLEEWQAAAIDGRSLDLSKACQDEVETFLQAFTSNVNANIPIGACREPGLAPALGPLGSWKGGWVGELLACQ